MIIIIFFINYNTNFNVNVYIYNNFFWYVLCNFFLMAPPYSGYFVVPCKRPLCRGFLNSGKLPIVEISKFPMDVLYAEI